MSARPPPPVRTASMGRAEWRTELQAWSAACRAHDATTALAALIGIEDTTRGIEAVNRLSSPEATSRPTGGKRPRPPSPPTLLLAALSIGIAAFPAPSTWGPALLSVSMLVAGVAIGLSRGGR